MKDLPAPLRVLQILFRVVEFLLSSLALSLEVIVLLLRIDIHLLKPGNSHQLLIQLLLILFLELFLFFLELLFCILLQLLDFIALLLILLSEFQL